MVILLSTNKAGFLFNELIQDSGGSIEVGLFFFSLKLD